MKTLALAIFCFALILPFTGFAADELIKGQVGKQSKFSVYTDEQLEDALVISDNCKAYTYTNTRYDCDCVGLTYLELRQKEGDGPSREDLRVAAQRKCPNGPAMAGKVYTECLGWAPTQRGEDYEEFCTCYATNYSKVFSKNPSENQLVIESQMTFAMGKCDANSVNRRAQEKASLVEQLKEKNVYDRLFPGAQ